MEVLCQKNVPKKLIVLIYKLVIRPVLMIENEALPWTDYLVKMIGVCKIRMLSCIFEINLDEYLTNDSIRWKSSAMGNKPNKMKVRVVWACLL